MAEPVQSDARPGLASRLMRWALIRLYRSHGWTAQGDIPEPRRFIIIAAPHTSNWDFLYFLGLTDALGVKSHFMAKQSLFRWPFRRFLLDMGGVPVDRSGGHNYVEQMAAEFARRDEFILTIAPEGTRGSVRVWKTGFYHIAMAARVPMVVGLMDYGTKTGGLGPAIWPTGDYEADMAKVAEVYRTVTPKHPDKAMTSITGKEGE
ncbi:MAG: lysophospholipid acyltransferase family protein [Blastomonas sp.]